MDAHESPAPTLDEPKTPLGLTLLGIGLLLLGAVYWVASAGPETDGATPGGGEAAEAEQDSNKN